MEKCLNSVEIYQGKVIKVVKDEVVLDNGQKAYREIVHHHGGACIALKDGKQFYLTRQYRYAFSDYLLEFPAGKIEQGESPRETIIREVQEETGFEAVNLQELGYMIPTCGYSDERIYLYYGTVGKYVGQHLDKDERINLEKYTYEEIEQMIKDGLISDGKTIALMHRILMAGLND